MTNKNNKNQVSFYDEQLENFHFEYSILRRKLQSKVEALIIMSKELNECRIERDQYKLIAEQKQSRYSQSKKSKTETFSGSLDYDKNIATSVKMLNDLREENKSLTVEVGRLKQKLNDRDGDIRVLRQKLVSLREADSLIKDNTTDREDLITQLEILNDKVKNLKSDLRNVIDEKEELISERDAYKYKIHRLNHELKVLMSGDKECIEGLDVDALVMENKQLSDHLGHLETEKELMNQAILKYKSMLETKKKKCNIKLNIAENETILTQEQVRYLFDNNNKTLEPAKLTEVKNFVFAIIEAMNDRTLALAHQRKANKILASRITDLEQRLNPNTNSIKKQAHPSQIFLKSYDPTKIDSDFDDKLNEELKQLNKTTLNGTATSNGIIKGNVSNGMNSDDLKLPPHLEVMLKKALDDIKSDKNK